MATRELPLFMQPQTARQRDPDTSQLASGWLRSSGILAAQERQVLEALKGHPGATSQELAKHLAFGDRYVTSRRLAGLADKGMVRRGPKRFCQVSRMLCITWYPGKAEASIGTPANRPQASRAPEARESGPVLTPDERRRLRQQLAASGNAAAQQLTAAIDGEVIE